MGIPLLYKLPIKTVLTEIHTVNNYGKTNISQLYSKGITVLLLCPLSQNSKKKKKKKKMENKILGPLERYGKAILVTVHRGP
jgi:hypothetical protein